MAEPSFEKALSKLEKTVEELERGDFPLDEALKKYEDGIKLVKICNKKLEGAQRKVEILLKSGKGGVELELFDEDKTLETQ